MRDACPTPGDVPFFNRCMARARDMGLEWERALDYVIEQRKAGKGSRPDVYFERLPASEYTF